MCQISVAIYTKMILQSCYIFTPIIYYYTCSNAKKSHMHFRNKSSTKFKAVLRRSSILFHLSSMVTVDALPEDCLSLVISFASPCDACSSASVSAAFRAAADSDAVWESFLPSDYCEIMSRSVSPVGFSSKKGVFRRLSSAPLLIDGGKKTFLIEKNTNKKSYMLSARELYIAWSSNSLYWSWKPLLHSRFSEAAELIMVSWLELHGKIQIGMLSQNTTYGAYLVLQLAERAFGLDVMACEASIEIGNYKTKRTFFLKCEEYKRRDMNVRGDDMIRPRGDGWLEVELGEFDSSGREGKEEVNMWFRETKGVHLKGGIVVEGIELRPKKLRQEK